METNYQMKPSRYQSKYTKKGELRLSKKERSARAKAAWRTRHANAGTIPKKRKGPPDEIRSAAQKLSWRRRWRAGTAVKAKKRPLLSPEERSRIAREAAERRYARVRAAKRKKLKAAKLRKAVVAQKRPVAKTPKSRMRTPAPANDAQATAAA